MNKEHAKRVVDGIRLAERDFDHALKALVESGFGDAEIWCQAQVVELQVLLNCDLLEPLYEEYPNLRPVPLGEPVDFDVENVGAPMSDLMPVAEAFAALRVALHSAFPLVRKGATTPGERAGYFIALSKIQDELTEVEAKLGLANKLPRKRPRKSEREPPWSAKTQKASPPAGSHGGQDQVPPAGDGLPRGDHGRRAERRSALAVRAEGAQHERWPRRRRALHSTLGLGAHWAGQVVRLGIEAFALGTGRAALRNETRVVRRCARLHWIAQTLDRRGRTSDAFEMAARAFAALKEADPRDTFPQMGLVTVGLMDELAQLLGKPMAARNELQELLRVLKALGLPSPDGSAQGQAVAWLEHRLEADR